jgi:hypothetical protein
MRDTEVLAMAAAQNRVLVSHDVDTMLGHMLGHFRTFTTAGNESSGVFLVPQTLSIGTAIDELLLVWLASEGPEWMNLLVWLL